MNTPRRQSPVLDTDRLRLRELTPEDAPFILQLVNEPSFLQHIGDRGVRNLDDARAYIQDGPVASYEQYNFGLYLTLQKNDGQAVGICGLLKRPTLDDVDIGFAFLPQYWRRGYGLESSAVVLNDAQERLGLRRVVAITSLDNEPSSCLLGKLGFRLEGQVRLGEDDLVKLFAIELPI